MAGPGTRAVSQQASLRLAYLLSQHPAVNHTFMVREVRQLRDLGLDVRVASIREPDRPEERLTREEIEEKRSTFYVKAQSLSSVLGAHLRTLFQRPGPYLRGLAHAIRLSKGRLRRTISWLLYFAEAVVVGDWMARNGLAHAHTHYASNVALLASDVFKISMSATLHGPDEFNDPASFHLSEKVLRSLFVRSISDFGRSQIMNSSHYSQWQKLVVNRLGVDTDKFCVQPVREDPRPFELLCAGRLARVKAQHVLIEAMQILMRQRRNVRLHLAGDGPDRRELEAHAAAEGLQDRIIFHGFINQEELRKLYEHTDVFVLPSFAEGVPVVLMEAMSMGIPCIATWVNGIPELIRHEVDGLTVTPGDAQGLAQAVGLLIDQPGLRSQLSARARQRAVELADLATNVRQLAGIFEQYLGGQHPGPCAPHPGSESEDEVPAASAGRSSP